MPEGTTSITAGAMPPLIRTSLTPSEMAMMASTFFVYLLREKRFLFSGKSTRREMIRMGTLAQLAGPAADRDRVGVVKMGQDAAFALHRPGETERGADAHLALHPERQDGKPFGRGFFVERAVRAGRRT